MTATAGELRGRLLSGLVIPAHPLAVTADRAGIDEKSQRALTRYYLDAGAGGIAVGVHTTQFAIREHGLYRGVLQLAAATADAWCSATRRAVVRIAGVIGETKGAVAEAGVAVGLGYDAGLLSLGAWRDRADSEILEHCRAVAEVIPLFGFYLQPAVGGRVLGYEFWREFAEIPNVVAIKIAPFDRYRTIDVVRAVADAGREDVALYTGNDDNIVGDLLTPFRFVYNGRAVERRIVGGLLGQWAVGTKRAVELLAEIARARASGTIESDWLRRGAALTDMNAAIFDARHAFAGCIAGIHEVLRRQGLMRGIWCLDPGEQLSPGQSDEITRVLHAYPELTDEAFIRERLDAWLR